jgi:transcription antitermination factor NusA-like protein
VLGVQYDVNPIREAVAAFQPDVAFNLLEEFHGLALLDHGVVSYLELLRLRYTGCNARGLMIARGKALSKKLLAYHRIRVPAFAVFPRGRAVRRPEKLGFPLIVKSLVEHASLGIALASVVDDDARLAERVGFVHERIGTDAIAEQFVEGREVYVGVIGNDRIQVLIVEVKEKAKIPMITVSRTHPDLVKRLFEREVPEIGSGDVLIKSIAREAGSRTKMAVYSKREGIDPIGSCVGQKGTRVRQIVTELKGEKIDIIKWSEMPEEFIASALSPAQILGVAVDEEAHSARVVVPDDQLSLAIGKEGQNARLAARLTGWKIDILNSTRYREESSRSEE